MNSKKNTQNDCNLSLESNIQINIDSAENDAFSKIDYMYVAQRFNVFTASSHCDNQNVYFIYAMDNFGTDIEKKKSKPCFKANAETECYQRISLPSSCRSFNMEVKQNLSSTNQKLLFTLNRNYKCSCLCVNRPDIKVIGSTGNTIGYVRSSLFSIQKTVEIFDANNNLLFNIKGIWNQFQTYCYLPCGFCQTISFDILNRFNKLRQRRSAKRRDVVINAFQFPKLSSFDEKALILSAVFFLDYNYYEERYSDMCCLCLQKCCCSQCIE
ncbi:unnamed protein product (macronuclear) [Paramecium tetraurelia]|uniref:Phospholipid scramblase n=1 Tax=Paramecium tetraurelia TaxID=5888 RepID=A0DDE4_PARTE|nr:uncharacterized protein GSPATT00015920001 [Paramecium tetraurelia]CAK81061.1 unnamed protein product [Paramecium tetraurelia]|eukprot:XP_001448458.1 hypothetical protein (macronuclear) [Paramecium tetraurelia strain d4-2]